MKILMLFIFLMNFFFAFAQTTYMRVNKTDGTTVLFAIGDIKEIKFSGTVGIKDLEKWGEVLNAFNKMKCFPNPTNSIVTIEYNLPENGNADLLIYNNSGALVYKKPLENQFAGYNQIIWAGTDIRNNILPNGIYHCNISFKNTKLQEKIIILK